MEFLTIERGNRGNITIKDTITGNKATYYGYNVKTAEKAYRAEYGLRGKHFTKIFI